MSTFAALIYRVLTPERAPCLTNLSLRHWNLLHYLINAATNLHKKYLEIFIHNEIKTNHFKEIIPTITQNTVLGPSSELPIKHRQGCAYSAILKVDHESVFMNLQTLCSIYCEVFSSSTRAYVMWC